MTVINDNLGPLLHRLATVHPLQTHSDRQTTFTTKD